MYPHFLPNINYLAFPSTSTRRTHHFLSGPIISTLPTKTPLPTIIPIIKESSKHHIPSTMTISISKFFNHELRSNRVAYQEHLLTDTTTTRKEKSVSAEKQPSKGLRDRLNKENIVLTQLDGSKPKDKRVQELAMKSIKGTKEADLISNWSGETLCGDGKPGRY